MVGDPRKMTCAEFQAVIPELIASDEDATLHPHAQECDRCRSLLVDLEMIAEEARRMFPNEEL